MEEPPGAGETIFMPRRSAGVRIGAATVAEADEDPGRGVEGAGRKRRAGGIDDPALRQPLEGGHVDEHSPFERTDAGEAEAGVDDHVGPLEGNPLAELLGAPGPDDHVAGGERSREPITDPGKDREVAHLLEGDQIDREVSPAVGHLEGPLPARPGEQ